MWVIMQEGARRKHHEISSKYPREIGRLEKHKALAGVVVLGSVSLPDPWS